MKITGILLILLNLIVILYPASVISDTKFNVYVPGNAGWFDTAVAISAGDTLIITATGLVSGTSGMPPSDPPDGSGYGPANNNYLAPGLERYSLVGKIGNNIPFQVGSSYSGVSNFNGTLFLAYNDEEYSDNSGGYTVDGQVKPPGTIITSDITENTNWTKSGSPYIINANNVSVTSGVTLTIDPGVEVRLADYALICYGKIIAIGTVADTITFTSNLKNPNPHDWDRILVKNEDSDGSEFKFCKIQYARIGVSFENTSSKISDSIIESCERSGVSFDSCSSIVEYCIIRNITNEGVYVASGAPEVNGNKIYNNTDGVVTDHGASIIQNNLIFDNSSYGIDNRNADDTGAIAKIVNNTLFHNGILGTGDLGANINCDNSSPIIKNNIITNSTNNVGAGYGAGIRATSGGSPVISYNDVWNNSGGNYTVYGIGSCAAGQGDIAADPKFVDASSLDFHLQDDSPCIRAASPNDGPITDIEQTQRGNPPDMGAFENISDGDQSLPVELTNFEVKLFENIVKLSWETDSETNNLGFELYRKQAGDSSFSLISSFKNNDELKGAGTSVELKKYNFLDKNIAYGFIYEYKIVQIDFSGKRIEYPKISIHVVSIQNKNIPWSSTLFSNYPNPFNPETTIKYYVQNPSALNIVIFNLSGQIVKRFSSYHTRKGYYQTIWNATDNLGQPVPTGTYFCKLTTMDYTRIIKMLYLK